MEGAKVVAVQPAVVELLTGAHHLHDEVRAVDGAGGAPADRHPASPAPIASTMKSAPWTARAVRQRIATERPRCRALSPSTRGSAGLRSRTVTVRSRGVRAPGAPDRIRNRTRPDGGTGIGWYSASSLSVAVPALLSAPSPSAPPGTDARTSQAAEQRNGTRSPCGTCVTAPSVTAGDGGGAFGAPAGARCRSGAPPGATSDQATAGVP